MKIDCLGVPEQTIEEHGAVSQQTAEAMAVGARRRAGSTYAISITGVAGPDGGTERAPVGTVYVGLADAGGCRGDAAPDFWAIAPGYASSPRKWRWIFCAAGWADSLSQRCRAATVRERLPAQLRGADVPVCRVGIPARANERP